MSRRWLSSNVSAAADAVDTLLSFPRTLAQKAASWTEQSGVSQPTRTPTPLSVKEPPPPAVDTGCSLAAHLVERSHLQPPQHLPGVPLQDVQVGGHFGGVPLLLPQPPGRPPRLPGLAQPLQCGAGGRAGARPGRHRAPDSLRFHWLASTDRFLLLIDRLTYPYLQVADLLGQLLNEMVGPDMVWDLAAGLSHLQSHGRPASDRKKPVVGSLTLIQEIRDNL
ncbi:hypothetical protein EYF80_026658 [Liparis tanakae]|uniref:Uncharacterized protein n=1 Tax=Liparis tanakae TaxID=230148 RepID=A0A4Z2HE64_9TELE|nr:hypothetical protein EYF80_026658 [Liparis tanakae]